MDNLSYLFNMKGSVTAIFRGDCTARGYLSSSVFNEGQRFDLMMLGIPYTFIADKIEVKPLYDLHEDLRTNINGPGILPLVVATDEGNMSPDELCTVVHFRPQTKEFLALGSLSPSHVS